MGNTKLHTHREKAEHIRAGYTERVAAIKADRDLSEEGKRRQLASEYLRAKGELDRLADAERAELTTRKTELEHDLFGARGMRRSLDGGAHAISARDASDRAAQLTTPAAAADLLRRAEADGDELLARAVARRCIESSDGAMTKQISRQWDEVTTIYLDSRPSLMPVVEELAEIETMTTGQIFSPFSVRQPNGVQQSDLRAAQGEPVTA